MMCVTTARHVHGLVVYTGHDTRIQMNAAKVPLKMGSFDLFLNVQIIILIVAQVWSLGHVGALQSSGWQIIDFCGACVRSSSA